jgi:serine/threonine protein kinase
MTLAAGTRLDAYTIVAPLGVGGMGEVYRARDGRLGRDVALKVISGKAVGDPEALALFEREARTLATLSHPNILSIFDFGRTDGHTYAVMELLEGGTLRERLGGQPLPWRTAAAVAMAVAKGLSAAHAKGIVHRDLKPENIFVQADGQVKILDFGLAHIEEEVQEAEEGIPVLGRTGFVGSKLYMAPEQICHQPVDTRTDIFGLGLVLYEMLVGRHPIARLSTSETMAAILREAAPPVAAQGKTVPPALADVVHTCLAQDPARRFPTALDLMLALGEVSLSPEMARPSPTVWLEHALWFGIGLFVGMAATGLAWLFLT